MINLAIRTAKINFGLWATSLSPGQTVHDGSGLSAEDIRLLAALMDISLSVDLCEVEKPV
jgi:hypothetical protein